MAFVIPSGGNLGALKDTGFRIKSGMTKERPDDVWTPGFHPDDIWTPAFAEVTTSWFIIKPGSESKKSRRTCFLTLCQRFGKLRKSPEFPPVV